VTVAAGATAEVAFVVACTAATGSLRIRTTTTGDSPDQDGYSTTVDARAAQPIEVNGSLTVSGLNPGSHQVTLGGLASNCTVSGSNPRSATVNAGNTVEINFSVSCPATSTTGSIEITTTTTGSSPDDGYTIVVDAGAAQPIGANTSITVSDIAAGEHQVTLGGIAANCTAAGENPRTVTVTVGATAPVAFSVTCTGPQPSSSKIAFNSFDAGTAAIYVVNPDGTGLTTLTPQGEDDRRPLWSPDRSKLAFVQDRVELWVMSSDGQNRARLTNRLGDGNSTFRWSPDGSMIVFETNDALIECDDDGVPSQCPLPQVWTMRADGSDVTKVADGAAPSWAPDSRRIAFAADRQIQVANADGTGRRTLTNQPGGAYEPAWSPAGGRIAFVTLVQREREVGEILVMNEDGSQVSNLTSGRGHDSEPLWSPNGSKIAFITFDPVPEGTHHELAVMNPDGNGRTILTASDGSATWSPQGDRLAFMRRAFGDPIAIDVYLINVDGGGERNLTNTPEITDDWPSWSSD
jgi:TolB protein